MKKLLATLTTVAMLATSTVAFAGFDKEAGTYSVDTDLSAKNGQLTLLIIPEAAYQADEIKDEDILYIDQGAYTEGLFQNVGILGGTELKPGNYYAKIGGKELGGIIVEKFTIVEESQGEEVQLGNTNGDAAVNGSDINPVIQHILGAKLLTGQSLFAANTNGDAAVNGSDINPIIQHILGAKLLGTGLYVGE